MKIFGNIFENIRKALNKHSKHYDKFVLAGDFNPELCLSQFLIEYNVKNIVKENTYFKNALNPSCIDLFIKNSPLSFQNTIVVFNRLCNIVKMVIIVMEMSFKRHSLIERHYRDYKYFDQTRFKNNLNEKLSDISNYESFETAFIELLNKHVPLKKKFLKTNYAPYFAKTLRKTLVRKSQRETNCLKTKTQTDLKLYKNHKNICGKLIEKEKESIMSP